jgi:hypothetical protein
MPKLLFERKEMKEYLKVEKVLDLIEGTSDTNRWEKQTVVFSTTGDKPVMLAIDFMGERKTKTTKHLNKGQLCEVSYSARSREYGDKWFTNLEGWSVKPLQAVGEEQTAPPAPAAQEQEQPAPPSAMKDDADGLFD